MFLEKNPTGFNPDSKFNKGVFGAFSDYVSNKKEKIQEHKRRTDFDEEWEKLCSLIQFVLRNDESNDQELLKHAGFNKKNIVSEIQNLNTQLKGLNYYYELEGKIYDPSIRKMASGLFGRTTDYNPIKDKLNQYLTERNHIDRFNFKNIDLINKDYKEKR